MRMMGARITPSASTVQRSRLIARSTHMKAVGSALIAVGLMSTSLLHPPAARAVSVLFARSDSCYKDLVTDVWDIGRDARNYQGDNAVICHPPCRAWGRLRRWAKPRTDEKALALFAVDEVRRCGGVLEHPYGSTLWGAAQLPLPGHTDDWGGFTILVEQGWWDHPAPKPTYLYIAGCRKSDLPELPVKLHRAAGRTLDLSPADRERTPPAFAEFLLRVASMCRAPQLHGSRLAVTATAVAGCNTEPAPAAVTAADKRAAFKRWAVGL